MKNFSTWFVVGSFALCGCGDEAAPPHKSVPEVNKPKEESEVKDNSAAEARAILDRAIQAHGGEKKLAQLRVMRIKQSVKSEPFPGQGKVTVWMEGWWQAPNQSKIVSQFEINGNKTTEIRVINGDQGWSSTNGMLSTMSANSLAEEKEMLYAQNVTHLLAIKEGTPELAVLKKEQMVEGKPVVGVRIKSKGHREVVLYFDKETHLLKKRKRFVRSLDREKLIPQEAIFSDYDRKAGVMHHNKLTVMENGATGMEAEVHEVQFLPKIPDEEFRKPEK